MTEWAAPTPEQFRAEIQRGDQPAVLRGIVGDWPLVKAAHGDAHEAMALLETAAGADIAGVLRTDPDEEGRFHYSKGSVSSFNFIRGKGNVAGILAGLREEERRYRPSSIAAQTMLAERFFPGFAETHPLPWVPAAAEPRIWIGNAAKVATHNDPVENVAVVAAGRRRFTLFPPSAETDLYMGPQYPTPAGARISMVHVTAPDFEMFPRFAAALEVAQVAELSPGRCDLHPARLVPSCRIDRTLQRPGQLLVGRGGGGRLMLQSLALAALLFATPASAKSILFVGNSFTFGADSPVMTWNPTSVTDLNHDGVGGVPALFKRFASESGLYFEVSLETAAGQSLDWHWRNRRALLDRSWDYVVLQEYSTLDPDRPGNPAKLISASRQLATMFRARNPRVKIALTATWSRPDQTFTREGHWAGSPIERMALDIRRADDRALRSSGKINWVVPVGQAFNCAIASGIADANPYDGIDAGKIDLWADDHYHASTAGYYLEALTVFARITGRDPRKLGPNETAARELNVASDLASRLQRVAYQVALGGRCPASAPGLDAATKRR